MSIFWSFTMLPYYSWTFINYNFRNQDFQEVVIEKDGEPMLRFALAYGFRNIQNIVQKVKRGKLTYDFVEIMACPSGIFPIFFYVYNK